MNDNSGSRCCSGTTWTLDEEAEDLAREVEAMRPGGPGWSGDGPGHHFLGHLSDEEQAVFITHLRAGRLRDAIQMVANNAYKFGIVSGPKLTGERRVKLITDHTGFVNIKFNPQRIPENVGIILSHAFYNKVPRSVLGKVLRKGGKIQAWGMPEFQNVRKISQRDVNGLLKSWPWRSKARNPGGRDLGKE